MFVLNFYEGKDLVVGGVPLKERVTVGRGAGNDVLLPDTNVSRTHAVFTTETAGDQTLLILQDLGSTNGCAVNGVEFKGKRIRVLPEDTVVIAGYRVEIVKQTSPLDQFDDDDERTIVYHGPSLTPKTLPIDRLRALHELTSHAATAQENELLDATWKTIVACLRYDALCVLVRDENEDDLVKTWNADGPCPPSDVAVSGKMMGKCINENLVILSDRSQPGNMAEDSAVWNSLSCGMCVPLGSAERNRGAIYVSSDVSQIVYDRDDLDFLMLVAHQVSTSLANRKAMNDLKAEAQKLEAILGSLHEGVLVMDAAFTVISANHAARRILGSAQLKGRPLEDVLVDCKHTFDRASVPSRASFEVVVPEDASGSRSAAPRVYAAAISENTGSDRNSWKYVVSLHDLTHVERNERLKSLFVNRLAHKLRTPLTVITGVNALIAEQGGHVLDAELQDLLKKSLESSEQCSELIDRFVEYTTLDLGQDRAAAWTACSLQTLVAAAEDASEKLIASRRFSVDKSFPSEPILVRGHKENLALAFQHIIQNAVKFSPPGGKLRISAECKTGGVLLRFQDNGPGIPPTEVENLFQMLHQVDAANTGQVPGAGLGLWLVKTILEAHSGDIRVTSPTGGDAGTLVEITLPQHVPATGAATAPPRCFVETGVMR